MSRTRMIIGFASVALALLAVSALAGPGKGPAEKATGGLVIEENNGSSAKVEFNAHEQKGDGENEGDQAKGTFTWWLLDEDGEAVRTIVVDVSIVRVEGDTAWFAGAAVSDTENDAKVGDWLYVKVVDDGTPGAFEG